MEYANQPLVLDNGSGTLKAGFSGESAPKTSIYNFVGQPKHERSMVGALEGEHLIGADADTNRGLLRLRYPMKHGIVEHWDDMERVWYYLYERELAISSEDHPVLLTEAPLNPKQNRLKAAEIFFETFNVPALYFSIQAVLSLYASGKTTGLVLDCGDGVTHSVPVFKGFSISSAIKRSDVAGRDVTEFLQLLLRKQGIKLTTSAEREIVREIKEYCCSVGSKNTTTNTNEPQVKTYTLPDGQKISLGEELTRAPEVLFRPLIIGSEDLGCHELLEESIARTDMDLRSGLYQNVVLSGGSTFLKMFPQRVLEELKQIAPPSTKLRIFSPPDRKISPWIGGSILAGLSTFRSLWVTSDEWQERPDMIFRI